MKREILSMIISSCDAYSDLWDIHVELLNKNWHDRQINTFIATDKITEKQYSDINIISVEGLEVPRRLKAVAEKANTKYILVTLDDYFIVDKIDNKKIRRLINIMEKENLDYVRMWPFPHSNSAMTNYEKMYWVSYDSNYQVNLYPAIWKTDFLVSTCNTDKNVWQYEVSLTETAKIYGARSAISMNDDFPFLDVIRKGKVLHKAKRFLDKNGYKLEREIVPRRQEIKLDIMYYAKEILPKPILKIIKKILIKCGRKFISDGI